MPGMPVPAFVYQNHLTKCRKAYVKVTQLDKNKQAFYQIPLAILSLI